MDDEDLGDVIIYTGEGGRGPDLRILVFPDPKKDGMTETIVPRHSVNFVWQTIIGLTQCLRLISAAVNLGPSDSDRWSGG